MRFKPDDVHGGFYRVWGTSDGVLEPAHESQLQASLPQSSSSDNMWVARNHMVGVFTPWKSANTIYEGFFFFLKEPVVKHLLANSPHIASIQQTLAIIICNALIYIGAKVHVTLGKFFKKRVHESLPKQITRQFLWEPEVGWGLGVVGDQRAPRG